jgi:hypothetical protein
MKLVAATQRALGPCRALALIMGLSSTPALAFVEEITAVFRPDPGNPMINTFENTTPQSGICPWHIPAQCKAMNIFTIRRAFTAASNQPILAYAEDPRKTAYFKVPSAWRDFQVTHRTTGETETVQMRIAGIGGAWNVAHPPGVSGWSTIDAPYWGTYWNQAPAPCRTVNYLVASITSALFFWIVPENAGACSVKSGFDFPWMTFSHLEYAYELRTPNPLSMSAGEYIGGLTYTMGPGGDFDFGDVIQPGDTVATFNFQLSVEHALKVDVPPGGNRIELIPQGGWQAWLNQGRAPGRLYRDQTFRIAASSRFKMQLECSLVMGNTCGLRSREGDEVPLQVAVSLPNGLVDQYGQTVSKLPLRLDGVGSELFQPLQYVNDRPGSLHFEVQRDDMAEMLKRPGSTYSGVVTVVWDSQV